MGRNKVLGFVQQSMCLKGRNERKQIEHDLSEAFQGQFLKFSLPFKRRKMFQDANSRF